MDDILYKLIADPLSCLGELRKRNLLKTILPEVAALINLNQKSDFHTEDVYMHTLNVLKALPENSSTECILAAIFHDVGKAVVQSYDKTKDVYHFYSHEKKSLDLFKKASRRLGFNLVEIDVDKISWLIDKHMKAQLSWSSIENPKKTIEKNFFGKEKFNKNIYQNYYNDFLVFLQADILGAVPCDKSITVNKTKNLCLFSELLTDINKEIRAREKKNSIEKKVKKIWNGNSVLRLFSVKGPEVGCLLELGQKYVLRRMYEGDEPVDERDVTIYVKKILNARKD